MAITSAESALEDEQAHEDEDAPKERAHEDEDAPKERAHEDEDAPRQRKARAQRLEWLEWRRERATLTPMGSERLDTSRHQDEHERRDQDEGKAPLPSFGFERDAAGRLVLEQGAGAVQLKTALYHALDVRAAAGGRDVERAALRCLAADHVNWWRVLEEYQGGAMQGEGLRALGKKMGVSHETVSRWNWCGNMYLQGYQCGAGVPARCGDVEQEMLKKLRVDWPDEHMIWRRHVQEGAALRPLVKELQAEGHMISYSGVQLAVAKVEAFREGFQRARRACKCAAAV